MVACRRDMHLDCCAPVSVRSATSGPCATRSLATRWWDYKAVLHSSVLNCMAAYLPFTSSAQQHQTLLHSALTSRPLHVSTCCGLLGLSGVRSAWLLHQFHEPLHRHWVRPLLGLHCQRRLAEVSTGFHAGSFWGVIQCPHVYSLLQAVRTITEPRNNPHVQVPLKLAFESHRASMLLLFVLHKVMRACRFLCTLKFESSPLTATTFTGIDTRGFVSATCAHAMHCWHECWCILASADVQLGAIAPQCCFPDSADGQSGIPVGSVSQHARAGIGRAALPGERRDIGPRSTRIRPGAGHNTDGWERLTTRATVGSLCDSGSKATISPGVGPSMVLTSCSGCCVCGTVTAKATACVVQCVFNTDVVRYQQWQPTTAQPSP
jgi:hypothetical protein